MFTVKAFNITQERDYVVQVRNSSGLISPMTAQHGQLELVLDVHDLNAFKAGADKAVKRSHPSEPFTFADLVIIAIPAMPEADVKKILHAITVARLAPESPES